MSAPEPPMHEATLPALPELPKHDHAFMDPEDEAPDILVWREKSVRTFALAYGQQCAEAARSEERERCARICESVNNHDNPMTANDCADAIRKGA